MFHHCFISFIGCLFLLELNSKLPHLLSRFQSSNSQHTCLIWLRLIFLHDLLDPPTRISSLCRISNQKWAADRSPLLHLPFGTLSLNNVNIFVRRIHCLFLGVCSRLSHIKSPSAIVINSLHIVSSDFDLRTYDGHSSLPYLWYVTKRALRSLLLLLLSLLYNNGSMALMW